MPIPGVITAQTGGRRFDVPDFTKYSYFVGGVNATSHALQNYSPQMNNFGRLFMIRPAPAMLKMFGGSAANLYSKDNSFIQFKHMCEYMCRSVTGFQDKTLENAGTPIQGGFANRSFNVPTTARETTNTINLSLYEFTGSPVYEVIDGWMNAIGDENSGLATYGGWISGGKGSDNKEKRLYRREGEEEDGIPFNEANHTCEFIYVQHDRSGAQVERAVLLADMYPMGLPQQNILDAQEGGAHDIVTYSIPFNCVVYRSNIITSIANDLLKQYRIVSNSLNFNPELGDAIYGNAGTGFNRALGQVPVDSATGTMIGNIPTYGDTPNAKTTIIKDKDMTQGKLAGHTNGPSLNEEELWEGFE